MKSTVLVSLLATLAAAAPAALHARDGPDGPAGGAATAAPPAAGGFDLGSLLQGIDLSKIGDMLQGVDIGSLMQNIDMSKIGDLMKGVDMSKIGDLMKGVDMSKIGDLMKGADMSKLGALASPDIMKTYGSFLDKMLTVQKAYKIEEMKPVLRSTAKRVKIIYGPYRIKGTDTKEKVGNGFSLDPSGTGYMYAAGDDFPRDITIIDVASGMFDENYVPIDIGKGLYNHHNVLYDGSKPVTSITGCASGKSAAFTVPFSIFAGGATESSTAPYTSIDGKFNSGYYLAKDAKVSSMIDVVNYNKADQNVYMITELEYVPGAIADALPASSQVLDIGTCSAAGQGFSVHPPSPDVKQWTLNSSDINITQDGYFLSSKAHMHDGGASMQMWLNGKEICKSVAEYGGPGREGKNPDGSTWEGLGGTTTCDKVVPVKKGDVLRISANFDVAAHPERQFEAGHEEKEEHGGMGGMGGEGSMAEGMALFAVSFAQEVPGANPKYLFTSS